MGILTLIKANIRHRKSNFISIFILMLIVSIILTSAVSIENNVTKRIRQANAAVGTGDFVVYVKDELFSADLESKLVNSENVRDVKIVDSFMPSETIINGQKAAMTIYFTAYDKENKEYGVFNDDKSAFISDVKPLADGEIYLPMALSNMISCEKGDNVSVDLNGRVSQFSVAGFIEEPFMGCDVVPMKNLFITQSDFDRMCSETTDSDIVSGTSETSAAVSFKQIHIYADDKYENDTDKFCSQVNDETQIIDYSFFSISREQSQTYALILPKILCGVLYLFMGLLMIVVAMVLSNNIGTSIEMEYVNIGILKSQGLSKKIIRLVLLIQYLLPAVTGSAAGLLASLAVVSIICPIFITASCLMVSDDLLYGRSISVLLIILALLCLFIFIKTSKVSKISPVRAISGGLEDVQFSSIFRTSVLSGSKNLIGVRLALRQLTTNLRQYAGTGLILAFLVCYLSTCYAFKENFTETFYDEMYGLSSADICVEYNGHDNMTSKTEKEISEVSPVLGSYWYSNVDFFMDSVPYSAQVVDDMSYIKNITAGKKAEYDNELLITNCLSKKINKEIGDKVVLKKDGISKEFMICGTYDSVSYAGKTFALSFEAAQSVDPEIKPSNRYYIIEDSDKADKIAGMIDYKYSDDGIRTINPKKQSDSYIQTVMDAMKSMILLIYTIAVIFTVIVIWMVCNKSFLKERMSIRIFKVNGFSTFRLKMQFCLRYMIVAVAAGIFGEVLYVFFGDSINLTTFMALGFVEFDAPLTVVSIVIPLAIICFFVFAASYFTLCKINKVSSRELTVE